MTNINEQQINTITELDFTAIKESLKNFLKNQTQFSDYDFEGSNLTALLDILAYNTHYQAFYLNMIASEMYLSTATRRDSVVKIAKQLGYTPRSAKCAIATLTVEVFTQVVPAPATLVIPSGTVFTTDAAGTKYTFTTTKDYLVTRRGDGRYIQEGVEIVEGRRLTQEFIIRPEDLTGVVIPNANVDTDQLTVFVRSSINSSDDIFYNRTADIVGTNENSLIYLVEEIDNQRYKLRFGDNVVGRGLAAGNVVTVIYFVTSGAEPNGANLFALASTIPQVSAVSVITTSVASGGDTIETPDATKILAPLLYQTQRRAVTSQDYVQIILSLFGDIDSAFAWGGEDNDPPLLGYVFISMKPKNGEFLTEARKLQIEQTLRRDYCPLTIVPIVVDPEFVDLVLEITVKYNTGSLSAGPAQLQNDVLNAVIAYSNTDLNRFSEYFRYSKVLRAIDTANLSITNSLATVRVSKTVQVSTDALSRYKLNFFNTLKSGTFESRPFRLTISGNLYNEAFVRDNEIGELRIYERTGNIFTEILGAPVVGSIDYDRGTVLIDNFLPDQVDPDNPLLDITFRAEPLSDDVYPERNALLRIRPQDVSVAVIPDDIRN